MALPSLGMTWPHWVWHSFGGCGIGSVGVEWFHCVCECVACPQLVWHAISVSCMYSVLIACTQCLKHVLSGCGMSSVYVLSGGAMSQVYMSMATVGVSMASVGVAWH